MANQPQNRVATFARFDADDNFDAPLIETQRDQEETASQTVAAPSPVTPRRPRTTASKRALVEAAAASNTDLADPAQVAEMVARYQSLNDSALKLAREKVALETVVAAHETVIAQRDETIKALEAQLAEIQHEKELSDVKVSVLLRTPGHYIRQAIGYGAVLAVGSFAVFAAFSVVFL